MSYQKLFVFLALVTGVTAMAQTNNTVTRTFDFPPVGLGSTETARINLTNVATASSSGTAASCAVSVSFLNPAGTTIGSATSLTIGSGITSSASLPFSSSGLTAPRGAIRGVITVTRTTTALTPCSLQFSLETFDTATGAGHFLLTGSESFSDRGH